MLCSDERNHDFSGIISGIIWIDPQHLWEDATFTNLRKVRIDKEQCKSIRRDDNRYGAMSIDTEQ